jgi:hypothetical protein
MTNNGRLDLFNMPSGTPLFLQEKVNTIQKTNFSNAMKYSLENTHLSVTFFSAENVTLLESGIKAEVYRLSNGKHLIDKQDYDQMYMIMRSIFLQHARHQEGNIPKQIEELNRRVIEYCAPRIMTEIVSYIHYKKDISNLVVPLDKPKSVSKDKSIEFKRFF